MNYSMNIEKRKQTEEQNSNKKSNYDNLCEDLQNNLKIGGLRDSFHGDMYQLSLLIIAAYRANKAKKEFIMISEG